MGATTLLLMATEPASTPAPCRDCRQGACKWRPFAVKSYVIAYNEAVKGGDDPAEYIRDAVRPSRDDPNLIDPAIYSKGRRHDPAWALDIKLSLEHARDVGGIALVAWNADRIAAFLCTRALEGDR